MRIVNIDGTLSFIDRGIAVHRDNLADLAAEIRRLRSDEWLERAAKEIATGAPDHIKGRDWSAADDDAWVLAILRKHRDGKA